MPELTYLESIRRGLREEMLRDDRVFLLGEDIADYGGAFRVTEGFLGEFGPDRVIDTPLAEEAIAGVAVGAAMLGQIPVAEFQFADFMACAFDQITNYAAKSRYRFGMGVPAVFRAPCGGGVRGGPFHSQNMEAYFNATPGLKIVAPSSCRDALGLIKAAIRDPDPVLYFEHKYLYRRIREEIPAEEEVLVPIGSARVVRHGRDLTIITYGAMVHVASQAASTLAEQGLEVEIVDLRTLRPLDCDTILESVARTNRVLVLHEATRTGGIAGEIAAIIAEWGFEHLDAPIARVTAPDTPVPFAPALEDAFLPSPERVARTALELTAW